MNTTLDITVRKSSALVESMAFVFDRLIIPIAVVVGLAGGAMIGSHLVAIYAPQIQTIH